MQTSLLQQQYWIQQQKQPPILAFDRLNSASDTFSSVSSTRINSTNSIIKEFCPEENDEDEDLSWKR